MRASTFANSIRLDHDHFERETLEAIEHVRRHAPPPSAGSATRTAHA
ncbi:MAG: hypothetical protein WB493_16755 [Anaeromyxobacteraceae bacterium]